MGHTATIRAITTAAIILCPKLPPLGLRQGMHNPRILLRLKDILNAPSISGKDNRIRVNITQSLILDALKRIYIDGVNTVFRDSNRYPKMPSMHCLPINKTTFWQFGAIFKDKGTIKGIYSDHKSIFLDQLGLYALEDPIKARAVRNDFYN